MSHSSVSTASMYCVYGMMRSQSQALASVRTSLCEARIAQNICRSISTGRVLLVLVYEH